MAHFVQREPMGPLQATVFFLIMAWYKYLFCNLDPAIVSHKVWNKIQTSNHGKRTAPPHTHIHTPPLNGHCLKLWLHHRPVSPAPAPPPVRLLPGTQAATCPSHMPSQGSSHLMTLHLLFPPPETLPEFLGLVPAHRSGLGLNVTTFERLLQITWLQVSSAPNWLYPSPGSVLLPRTHCHAKCITCALFPYLLPQRHCKIHESGQLIFLAGRTVSEPHAYERKGG